METTQAPLSNDGVYDLVDLSLPPSPRPAEPSVVVASEATPAAPAPAPTSTEPAKGGFFARFGRRRAGEPASEAKTEVDPEATPPPTDPASAGGEAKKAEAGPKLRRKKAEARTLRFTAPAWLVSA